MTSPYSFVMSTWWPFACVVLLAGHGCLTQISDRDETWAEEPTGKEQAYFNISGTPNESGADIAAEEKLTNLTGSEDPKRFDENTRNPSLASMTSSSVSGLVDTTYLEETAHFNRERIPERVVHAKGVAAFGIFEVTNTEIMKYTKATLFNRKGRRTPVVARFSNVAGESGSADTVRDVRGFAVKFYTDSGNWDIVGNNLPVFFISDPINFTPFIHSQKRNPQTHLRDPNAFWDFVALLPESLHTMLMLFSERGIPSSVREMHGFGVNTFKLINARGEAFYAKFHWVCDQGIRTLDQATANKLAGADPDYALRDLIVNIAKGNYPSWTLKFQVMSLQEALKVKFNVLDATKTWPHGQFPLIEIGRMTLNRNVDNYFAQVEQLAFAPANMVPGIEPSPDKMLLGRMISYPDAQRYRLGVNYADIPVNRFARPAVTPTHCDGITYTGNAHCGNPNYLPMKYNGQFLDHEQHMQGRFNFTQDDIFSQPRALYTKVLSDHSKRTLAKNIADHMAQVTRKEIVARVLTHFGHIDQRLRRDVENCLSKAPPKS
uniref:Catalase n=1 Tax=Aceria tosichella TaxID=561515 RepID=A0A6G1SM77_9ACAR